MSISEKEKKRERKKMKWHQKKILTGLSSLTIDVQWRLAALCFGEIFLPLMLKVKISPDDSKKVSAISLNSAYDEFAERLEHWKGRAIITINQTMSFKCDIQLK